MPQASEIDREYVYRRPVSLLVGLRRSLLIRPKEPCTRSASYKYIWNLRLPLCVQTDGRSAKKLLRMNKGCLIKVNIVITFEEAEF